MKYHVITKETFLANQILDYYIEAESADEAVRQIEDCEVFPDVFGTIEPSNEEFEREILECHVY